MGWHAPGWRGAASMPAVSGSPSTGAARPSRSPRPSGRAELSFARGGRLWAPELLLLLVALLLQPSAALAGRWIRNRPRRLGPCQVGFAYAGEDRYPIRQEKAARDVVSIVRFPLDRDLQRTSGKLPRGSESADGRRLYARARRRTTAPRDASPATMSAHVPGSGTGAAETNSTEALSKPIYCD